MRRGVLLLTLGLAAVVESFRLAPGLRSAPLRFGYDGARFISRAVSPRAALTPYRQDDTYNYYKQSSDTQLTLSKPIGAELQETEGKVVVLALQDGATTELKKGDCLKTVNGVDVTAKGLEEVMEIIATTEQFVVLDISRTTVTRRPRTSDDLGAAGVEPQELSKLDKAFQRNFASPEATQKLANKVVKTTLNPTTWKNPIYFWSIAGTAALFLPIIWYTVSK